jgi:hypothetical protein
MASLGYRSWQRGPASLAPALVGQEQRGLAGAGARWQRVSVPTPVSWARGRSGGVRVGHNSGSAEARRRAAQESNRRTEEPEASVTWSSLVDGLELCRRGNEARGVAGDVSGSHSADSDVAPVG